MNYLVIGGAGYIGSCFVEQLNNIKGMNDNIIIIDDLSTGYKEALHPEVKKIYDISILDEKKLLKVFQKENIDFVFHFGAKLLVGESVFQPAEYFENNVMGMVNIINCMRKINCKNIIFSSTAAVFGNPSNVPLDETSPKDPINPYGQSKLAAENLLMASKGAYGINYGILRYFNVVGASTSGLYGLRKAVPTLLIPVINRSVILGNSFKVFGNDYDTKDKTCIRDYIDINDLIDAHILLKNYMEKTNQSGAFNLGTQKGSSILEIIKATEEVLNVKLKYEFSSRRAGDPAKLYTKSELAKRVLGWSPKRTLKESIKSDYEFRLKNKLDFNEN